MKSRLRGGRSGSFDIAPRQFVCISLAGLLDAQHFHSDEARWTVGTDVAAAYLQACQRCIVGRLQALTKS